jgi:hypothetical protein
MAMSAILPDIMAGPMFLSFNPEKTESTISDAGFTTSTVGGSTGFCPYSEMQNRKNMRPLKKGM